MKCILRLAIKGMLCSALLTVSLLGVAAPAVTYARPHDKALCRLDQRWDGNADGDQFGSSAVLRQAFTPRVPSRICAVRLTLRRNMGRTRSGPVTLALMAGDRADPFAAASLPAAAIAEDAASALTFSFGCEGTGLPQAPVYGLRLSAPDSTPGAYTWVSGDASGAGHVEPAGVTGQRIRHSGGYTFQVFTCQ